jgi:hypothetical protein
LDDFTMAAKDINGDEKLEWIFYGPSGKCGAHGNCPLKIFLKDGDQYKPLNKDCQSDECLEWAKPMPAKY